MTTKKTANKLQRSRSYLYTFALVLLSVLMLSVLSACNELNDGVSITLSQEEYEAQFIGNDGEAVDILDGDVPLSEFSETADEIEDTAHPFIAEVLELVNIERKKANLPPLSGSNEALNKAAEARANELMTLFSHTRPNGQSWRESLKEYDVVYRTAGENLAKGHKSAEIVVKAWMNSQGHRANIMNTNFNNIGIGLAIDQKGILHWVQLFTN